MGAVHWTPQSRPLFGDRFTIEVWRTRGELWMNNTRLFIVHHDADTVTANDRNPSDPSAGPYTIMATLNLKSQQWSFNGLVGSGNGSLSLRESR